MKYLLVALVALTILLGTGCEAEVEAPVVIASSAAEAAPEQAQVVIDNDLVTVTKVTLKPREEIPIHEGKDRVVYSLNRYRLRYQEPDEAPVVKDFNEGDAHWHLAGTHSITNGGAITAEFLIIERKAPTPTPEEPSNLTGVARGYSSYVMNNADVRIVDVQLAAKGRVPNFNGSGGVVLMTSDGDVQFTSNKEPTRKEFKTGDILWLDAGVHSVRSYSSEPLAFRVFEFKPPE